MNLHDLTIKSFNAGLKDKNFSVAEVAKEYFSAIEEKDSGFHAYLSLDKENAYRQAATVDALVAESKPVPLLAGVPLAIKDNILIAGGRTTAAAKILENYLATYDAGVIKKLKSEQALFLGKTNMDEFAMGASTENSAFGPTRNPHDPERVPGGSSGGSAAAVAADMALAALGSDTGGSVRQPAAFCGAVGLKPTYGAVSRSGLIAMASSLDQIGPITKTVEDAAIIFRAIRGEDRYDATSSAYEYRSDFLNINQDAVKRMVVGVPDEYFGEGISNEVNEAVHKAITALGAAGVQFKRISLPRTRYALSAYYIVMPAEVNSNLARFDGIRYGHREMFNGTLIDLYRENKSRGFGTETKRRVILGTFVLSSGYYEAYYAKAQKIRQLVKQDFDKAFDKSQGEGVDVILTPTTPTPAFKIGEKTNNPLAMYMSDTLTSPASLAGLPAISIPVKGVTGLPIGFQLIGNYFREDDLFDLGMFYEQLISK